MPSVVNNRLQSLLKQVAWRVLTALSFFVITLAQASQPINTYEEISPGALVAYVEAIERSEPGSVRTESTRSIPAQPLKFDSEKTVDEKRPIILARHVRSNARAQAGTAIQLIRAVAPKSSDREQSARSRVLEGYRMASLTMPESLPIDKIDAPFTRLGVQGSLLAAGAEAWSCVADANNALIWEVKSSDRRIRDRNHTYSWYDEDSHPDVGKRDGGRCKGGIDCDTTSYVKAMNAQQLCGYSDWRLPTPSELQSIVKFDNMNEDEPKATIDLDYFPQTLPSWYWTATDNIDNPDYAWYVLFSNGKSLNDRKIRPKHIRLVRNDPLYASNNN